MSASAQQIGTVALQKIQDGTVLAGWLANRQPGRQTARQAASQTTRQAPGCPWLLLLQYSSNTVPYWLEWLRLPQRYDHIACIKVRHLCCGWLEAAPSLKGTGAIDTKLSSTRTCDLLKCFLEIEHCHTLE